MKESDWKVDVSHLGNGLHTWNSKWEATNPKLLSLLFFIFLLLFWLW